jgi:asparaginyl-tRNA synthetase
MEFVPIGDILDGQHTGKKVAVRGWVYRERKQKKVSFFLIREDSGVIQTAIKPDSKFWDKAQKLLVESSVIIEGKVKEDKRAPGGYEMTIDKLEIIDLAERFPITKDQSEEFLRDVRHLAVRSRKLTTIFKVRSAVFQAIHEFFKKKEYHLVHSPSFTGSAAEGGSTLFEVKYFDKKAYLTQTWQLYAEAMIFSLQKIYTIAPSFRAEKSRTRRHLAEYWHHEMETAWMTHDELMQFEEELILYLVDYVLKHCKRELKELGRDTTDLEKLKPPFMRMKYEEAIKKLGKEWGHDLTDDEERKLVAEIGKPVFITHFPREMKAFYMKVDKEDPRTVLASDLLIPGVGETTGGSERISDVDELLESLKLFKLDKKDYDWYIDLRRYGSIPHSGYGLGIGRLVMWLTGAEHIMDTVAFPRTMTRLEP